MVNSEEEESDSSETEKEDDEGIVFVARATDEILQGKKTSSTGCPSHWGKEGQYCRASNVAEPVKDDFLPLRGTVPLTGAKKPLAESSGSMAHCRVGVRCINLLPRLSPIRTWAHGPQLEAGALGRECGSTV